MQPGSDLGAKEGIGFITTSLPSPPYTHPKSQVPILPLAAHSGWRRARSMLSPRLAYLLCPLLCTIVLIGWDQEDNAEAWMKAELTRLSCSMTSLISGFRRCRRTTIFSLWFTGPQGGPLSSSSPFFFSSFSFFSCYFFHSSSLSLIGSGTGMSNVAFR